MINFYTDNKFNSVCFGLVFFNDADSSFSIIISINKTRKLVWRLEPKFQMGLHKRELSLLLQGIISSNNNFWVGLDQ
jgi:hypothetical protein